MHSYWSRLMLARRRVCSYSVSSRAPFRSGWSVQLASASALCLCVASSCSDDERGLEGRLLVGMIAAEDGTAVGLAVEFLRTSGDANQLPNVGLLVVAQGDTLLSDAGAAASLCLAFPSSGRLSLLAYDGKLDSSSRLLLRAYLPDPAADAGALSAGAREPECSGTVIDDAVWPTRGAQVIPLPEGTGGSTGGGGSGGTSGGESGAAGAPVVDAGSDAADSGEDAGSDGAAG